ncbi:MAG TPA: 4-hydroxybenzoate octaprenyltransferase [Steroidobacteraceae bacterium]
MSSRLAEYARLMRLDRPIGLWLLLWPALWALWLSGNGRPDERVFVIFVAGTFLMRAAGCVINDYADRRLDPQVRRTAGRPLARRAVSPAEALGLFAVLSVAALALLIPLGRLTQQLAIIGGALAVIYPFLKRFFPLPQAWLGAAFAWSVPMAFAEQTGAVPAVGWMLFAAAVFWTTAYDTIYAMVDREDDLRLGVRSSAILFGRADLVAVAALQLATLASLVVVGRMSALGHWYWLGLAAAAAIAAWQQWLIRDRDPAACFRAFLNNNYLGMAVFVGLALHYQFR